MSDRVTDLEIKLTFLERTVEELNHVVLEQHKRMDQLLAQLEALRAEFETSKEDITNEPPPHY